MVPTFSFCYILKSNYHAQLKIISTLEFLLLLDEIKPTDLSFTNIRYSNNWLSGESFNKCETIYIFLTNSYKILIVKYVSWTKYNINMVFKKLKY